MNWTRVTRRNPCPICGKPDWCEWTPDGKRILCMRVESPYPTKGGGWLHNLSGGNPRNAQCGTKGSTGTTRNPPSQSINCEAMLREWQQHQNGQLEPFAATLGVSQDALRSLGCVWAGEHRAFAFPMRDSEGRVIGIRIRKQDGKYLCVKGSRQGLFMSVDLASEIH